jgi:hypothetical protein
MKISTIFLASGGAFALSLFLVACNTEPVHGPDGNPEDAHIANPGGEVVPDGAEPPQNQNLSSYEYYKQVILPDMQKHAAPAKAATGFGLYRYYLRIYTGDVDNAGTGAHVYGQLIGSLGSSSNYYLDHPSYNDFERNQTDTFDWDNLGSYGDMTQLRLSHDNTGTKPGWYVDWAEIYKCYYSDYNCTVWYFDVNAWLATTAAPYDLDQTFTYYTSYSIPRPY